jgi:CRP-like cAMP-binding protein
VFGELALFTERGERLGRVRAETDARLLALPAAEALELVGTEASLGLALLRTMASRIAQDAAS